jgi:hypothetical protein
VRRRGDTEAETDRDFTNISTQIAEKTILSLLNCIHNFVKGQMVYMCRSIFALPILFHLSVCLLMYKYNSHDYYTCIVSF